MIVIAVKTTKNKIFIDFGSDSERERKRRGAGDAFDLNDL